MALDTQPKHAKPSGTRRIVRQMLALIPVLVIAAACYSVSVYAWFQASIVNTGNIIQTTTYDIVVTITGPDGTKMEAANSSYSLQANIEYSVSLTAAGGGQTGGYCVIQPGDGALIYTDQIVPGKNLTFTLIPDETTTYTFTAVWGKYTGNGEIITNKAVIGTEPAAPVNEQAAPTNDAASNGTTGTTVSEQPADSEPAGTAAPEQTVTSQPTETTEITISTSPTTSDPPTGTSSAVTSEPQSSEPATPDTTGSQATDTETTAPAASEPSDSELIQTESEPIEPVETE